MALTVLLICETWSHNAAIKSMCHSRRTVLTADGVDSAPNLRNLEPIYGFTSRDALRFKRAAGHKDLFHIDDKDVEFKEVIESPLSKAPIDTSVTSHWLAIEGIQPEIPENASVEAPSDGKKAEFKEDGTSVDVKLPVKHVLSRELQLYFDEIVESTMNRSLSILFKQALLSLATDSGLHPLVPYFTYFIADEVVLKKLRSKTSGINMQKACLSCESLVIPILRAAGLCMCDGHKMFPSLLAPPTRPVWKTSGKAATTNKRKASTDNLMQQPPVKKIATESAMGMMPINSMQADLQGAASSFSNSVGGSNIGISSSPGHYQMITC
ncbi:Transcription initiation factor TFIID subunit 6 [Hibiscus syriacus]|uniref:Transcription initiation factor TFIID subunit 6 n=1 Tax=Hibiscus syriacus TaxID=106335 RepID=A0A6A3D2F0_HIBSY|nr:Transcription initiation factor TFIID subunit 6 [Hibiscus syriacus]